MKKTLLITLAFAMWLVAIWAGAWFIHTAVAERAWTETPVILTAALLALGGVVVIGYVAVQSVGGEE